MDAINVLRRPGKCTSEFGFKDVSFATGYQANPEKLELIQLRYELFEVTQELEYLRSATAQLVRGLL